MYLHKVVGFPCGSVGIESTCNAGDLDSIPGLGRSPEEGKGYPLQYSGLENSMDSPWGLKESDTTEQLSLSVYMFQYYSLISSTFSEEGKFFSAFKAHQERQLKNANDSN